MNRGLYSEELEGKIREAKLLVVGVGGIGCELLKSLLMAGFLDITMVLLELLIYLY